MAFVYSLEPPTNGKVLLVTSAGEVDVELWPKEAPMAVRNFVQLCLEGYYDGVVFHRVIKGFMAQTGDPTGRGTGGNSVYGKPFNTEVHSRLKFTHRGLLAMATPPKQPNQNQSQFFITLDACEWLNRKHTIFGKVTGDTIFNVMKLGEVDVDAEDRPIDPPPRILSTQVLLNPFDDITPRKKATSDPPTGTSTGKKKPKRKKNVALLSFAEDEEEEVSSEPVVRGMFSAHEVVNDPTLVNDWERPQDEEPNRPKKKKPLPEKKEPQCGIQGESVKEMKEPEEVVRKMQVQSPVKSEVGLPKREETKHSKVELPPNTLREELEQNRLKYTRGRRSRKEREADTLAKLEVFKRAMTASSTSETPANGHDQEEAKNDDEDDEDDEDAGWLQSNLQFAKRPQDFDAMARNVESYEYTTVDTRGGVEGRRRRK